MTLLNEHDIHRFYYSGTAIPEGPTAYVMTEEGAEFWIWNSGTGEHFRTRDNNCPLQTVGCLINHENVSLFSDLCAIDFTLKFL